MEALPDLNDSLLYRAALDGFRNLTLAYLSQLFTLLEVAHTGAKPTLVRDLASACIRHVLGSDLTEEQLEEILSRRTGGGNTRWTSVCEDNQDLVQEAVVEGEQQQLTAHMPKKPREAPAPSERASRRQPEVRRPAGDTAPPPVAEESQPVGGEVVPRKKIVGPVNTKHYTQQDAAAWLPQASGCTICAVNNRCWQVKYSKRVKQPRSHTVTYKHEGPEGVENHVRALRECLQWAWTAHSEVTGMNPPAELQL